MRRLGILLIGAAIVATAAWLHRPLPPSVVEGFSDVPPESVMPEYHVDQFLRDPDPRVPAPHTRLPNFALHEELARQIEAASRALEAARLLYTENHPKVKRLESVLSALRMKQNSLDKHVPRESPPLSAYQLLMYEYSKLQGDQARLRSRINAIERAIADRDGPQETLIAAQESARLELLEVEKLLGEMAPRVAEAKKAMADRSLIRNGIAPRPTPPGFPGNGIIRKLTPPEDLPDLEASF